MTGFVAGYAGLLFGVTLDIAPIVIVLLAFQRLVLGRPIPNPRAVALGLVYVTVGLGLFLIGLEKALFPLGRSMASQLADPVFLGGEEGAALGWERYAWVYVFAAAVGFSTTIAEPSLLAVSIKANEVSGGAIGVTGLRVAVAVGVAVGVTIGVLRIVTGTPLHYYIIAGYALVMLQTAMAPRGIVALAYDSGGVTTSTVTVPIVTALGLGLASSVPGRSPGLDGFGLIAFASLFPIMAVLAYAQASRWRAARRG